MFQDLAALLECPACHGRLDWEVKARRGERIEEGEARCGACHAAYPVREGIALFLTPDLPRNDLWEGVDSRLAQYLREHPQVEHQLLETPLEALSPADQFYRAAVLEERGHYEQARAALGMAEAGIYSAEYRACHQSQIQHLLGHLSDVSGPIVDLASGRCGLVEVLAQQLPRPIVATDFSPRVLRRDRRWLEAFGLHERVSLLCFDARRTPFRDGAIATMTTNLGLPNIEQPAGLLQELRRIISGELLAVTFFYAEDDPANAAVIRQSGLDPLLFRRPALELFAAAGFQVELQNVQVGRALPTPQSALLEGAGIDALPVAETTLEWCLLAAH